MVPIYIGIAVVIVLIFVGFFVASQVQNHARDAAAASMRNTPTPAPGPTTKPIQLKDLTPIGKPTGFPQPNLQKNQLSDTPQGGRGQTVDGIPCETSEQVALHVHAHLAIFANGTAVQVPAFIGMAPSGTGGCLYWLHTHGPDGIIHIEAGDVAAPDGGPFTLGDFFDIWGEQLSRSQIGPFKGPVVAYVNGTQYNGDLRTIPVSAHNVITLEVGSPVVPPPNYKLPVND